MSEPDQATGTCMICGQWISPTFCVCAMCEEAYGLEGDAATWPAWAVALASLQRAERREEAERMEYEVEVGPDFLDEVDVQPICYCDYDTCWSEIASWGDLAYENALNDLGK